MNYEKLELIHYISTNSTLPYTLLTKKSIGWLRSMKARLEAEQKQNKFNKMMGYNK